MFLWRRTFANIIVYPTQRLLEPPFVLFRGGPGWPRFWLQRHARHCRGPVAIPLDIRPRRTTVPVKHREVTGIWCGPVTQHFGHAVASFGARLAASSTLASDMPLVFSAMPGEEPPPFFWQMLAHFGIAADRVRIVSTPVRFDRLTVVAQAERVYGREPEAAYLDLLDRVSGPPPLVDGSSVYVSRAGMWKGKIAGEAYLETALARAGIIIFRPETMTLAEQLATYRRASRLIFSEGSAMHALQLLGRIGAELTVIVRRHGSRLAQTALRPRVAGLSYVDAVDGLLHGLGSSGRAQPSAGMTIVNSARLIAALEQHGVAIGAHWDEADFLVQRQRDLTVWLEARSHYPTHRRDDDAIRRSVARLGLKEQDRSPTA